MHCSSESEPTRSDMKTLATNSPDRTRTRSSGRRGAVALSVVLSAVVLIGFVALGIDLAMVSYAHQQSRVGSEAAALGGGAELLNDELLYGIPTPREARKETILRAARAAQLLARQNVVAGQTLDITFDGTNHANGDIVVGWVAEPLEVGSPLEPAVGPDDRFNSILVRCRRTEARGNPVTLWFANLIGVGTADVMSKARATIDHRVYGFRPVGRTNVPLVPVGVLRSGLPEAWVEQAHREAVAGMNDRYSVDRRTGSVFGMPDGIPEVELLIPMESFSGVASFNAEVCWLPGWTWDATRFARQCAEGLTPEDLQPLGGELALQHGSTLTLPAMAKLKSSQAGPVGSTLSSILGHPVVLPLGFPVQGANGEDGFQVTDFAAGRVVRCEMSSGDALRVVIQPGVRQTATALVAAGWPHNPWIGKLFLTQ